MEMVEQTLKEAPLPDDFAGKAMHQLTSFYGNPDRSPCDWKAFHDPENRALLSQCILGVSREALEELNLPDRRIT